MMQVTDEMIDAALDAHHAASLAISSDPFEAMRAALTAALAAMWRTVSEAAKTGDDCLVYNEEWDWTFGGIQVARWDDGAWQFQSEMCLDDEDEDGQPTHFMPLPSPPKAEG